VCLQAHHYKACVAQTLSNAHLAFFLAQVEKSGLIVEETLFQAFQAICEYSEQHDPSSKRPTLIFDPVNSAVWIKLVKGSQVTSVTQLRIKFPNVRKVSSLLCEHMLRLMLSQHLCLDFAYLRAFIFPFRYPFQKLQSVFFICC